MALQNHCEDERRMPDDYLSSNISSSSSTLEIVVDDQSLNNSGDEESNDQTKRKSRAGTTDSEDITYRRKRHIQLRDPKSHRLIEKRRRDRMNACLSELLELTPHKNNDSQRRIEKTEIIEMAIDHIRQLIATIEKNSKIIESNLDAYRTGYRNALSDIFEFLNDYADHDQLLIDLTEYFKEKEIDLKELQVLPERKRTKYLTLVGKRIKSTTLSKEQSAKFNSSNKNDDELCTTSTVEEDKPSDHQSSMLDGQTSTEQYDSTVKVPIFVLHPSGTHYIPMRIDASIVSHAFTRNPNLSRSSSTTDQAQCHPVSIPVNFNPITAISDPYDIEVQNINVIGTRHQTSVRPN
ncbi:unnamed protein product [Rotaria magnacalcarata]|uniref:BHLH domain-containing protein n=1 Tax=Rotaria magnacalcarata TaxID=392030 RepID=A0A818YEE2_9BILA|nr:unnamed protein product [Rotaria magnacalcarata]CAF2137001.1 unnamed protein product [Rotaria magnacalcarata]CAF3755323.1 unnamed protein product [Rotaria magnacalcarata]CAF3823935.1 unnamed protein product [Rotaria magnacalcarata]